MALQPNVATPLSARDSTIEGLDPLQADSLIPAVPELNARADIPGLIALTSQLLTSCRDRIDRFSAQESAAAMRDLGILAGSIKRHGIEPCAVVQGLEEALSHLGRASGLPSRDTIYHYTAWNPAPPRLRTYTGLEQEALLILGTKESISHLCLAIDSAATFLQAHTANHIEPLEKVLACLIAVTKAREDVTRQVSPVLFINTLRPFYEPISVRGESLRGPSAASIPLHVLDYIVWGKDIGDSDYIRYTKECLQFVPHDIRAAYELTDCGKSLLTIATGPEATPSTRTMTQLIMQQLLVFRKQHLRAAAAGYRKTEGHYFKTGSGGYPIQHLGHLCSLTARALKRLRSDSGIDEARHKEENAQGL
jgi:hypothetical protein